MDHLRKLAKQDEPFFLNYWPLYPLTGPLTAYDEYTTPNGGNDVEKMKLVDVRYLITLAQAGGVVPSWDDVPDCACIGSSNLWRLRSWDTDSSLPVLVISSECATQTTTTTHTHNTPQIHVIKSSNLPPSRSLSLTALLFCVRSFRPAAPSSPRQVR